MRYQMQRKFAFIEGKYTVQDESGKDVFAIRGKFGKGFSFEDSAGHQLASMERKSRFLRRTYVLIRDGQTAATVRQRFAFRPRFSVTLAGGSQLEITGDLTAHEYDLSRNGLPAAHISKKWFSLADTYGVEVGEDVDPILALSLTVILDLMLLEMRRTTMWSQGRLAGR